MHDSPVGIDESLGWVDRWLSEPRFSPYLNACAGNREKALRLYEWNLDLGAILMKEISYFEVALRNAYDRVLCEHWHGECHWLCDDSSPVRVPLSRRVRSGAVIDANAQNRRKIADAAPGELRTASPDRVISHLPFGFWAHLTDRAHERVLWIPYLRHAWPKGVDRALLDSKIRAVNEVRNRIAHHERLFDPRSDALLPAQVEKTALELLGQLVPGCTECCLFALGKVAEHKASCPANVRVGMDGSC